RNFRAERDDRHPTWFRLYPDEGEASSLLVRLEKGHWVGAAAYKGFIGTFSVKTDGAETYALRRPHMAESGGEAAIAKAVTGSVLADPYELAALHRDMKHDDPVLGALAAYAYARAGAVEEIR